MPIRLLLAVSVLLSSTALAEEKEESVVTDKVYFVSLVPGETAAIRLCWQGLWLRAVNAPP